MRFILLWIVATLFLMGSENNTTIKQKIDSLQKPLYNPFVENYILHELKTLRDENRDLKNELYDRLAKKEVDISNNAINYATSTINNMFYIIAAASSFLVLIGWGSIKDMNEKVANIVDERVSNVISEYEDRMHSIEKDLEKRSAQVLQNQKDIERTNIIHSLWMRASQENTPSGKIEIYDEILSLRQDDAEVLAYKADAILELGEVNWALSLANQALEIDSEYPNALYQRAKAYSVLGLNENAIEDLEKALNLNEQYVDEIENQEEFGSLKGLYKFKTLIKKYTTKS
ncbi:MAG: tetratricopeptide repeat protein [Campylobacterales bacterium]|nr:tetratricopeptide repeat protein [Campylobacterales bacterium]